MSTNFFSFVTACIRFGTLWAVVAALLFVSVPVSFFSTHEVRAAFNEQINYQGKLVTSSGIAVANGTYNMEFKLYATSTGGTALWTETRTTGNRVQVTDGLFSVMLGEVTSLSGIDFNQLLYLGVNIGGTSVSPSWDGEMTPRKKLGAVPAAFVAENANTLGGLGAGNFFRQGVSNATTSSSTFLNITQNGIGSIADLIGASGTSVFTVTSSGRVGVGTSSPIASLAVRGTSGVNPFVIASSSGAALFTLLQNGNVGIGDVAPTARLSVNGQAAITSTTTIGSSVPSGRQFVTSNIAEINGNIEIGRIAGGGGTRVISVRGGSNDVNGDSLQIVAGSGGFIDFSSGTNGGDIRISGGVGDGTGTDGNVLLGYNGSAFVGNIGIGNSNPTQKLSVEGNFLLDGAFMPGNAAGSVNQLLVSQGASASPQWQNASSILTGIGSTTVFLQNGNSFGTTALLGTNDNQPLQFETNNAARMTILSGGNVGIGTTTPAARLSVAGTGSVDALLIASSSGSTAFRIQANNGAVIGSSGTANANGLYVGGRLNIGTSNGVFTGEHIENASGRIIFTAGSGYSFSGGAVGIGTTSPLARLDVYGAAGGNPAFRVSSSTNATMFVVGANGRVGIGTSSPAASLTVVGANGTTTGNAPDVLTVIGGEPGSTSGNGGSILLRTGNSLNFGNSGTLTLQTGDSGEAIAGPINLIGGNGTIDGASGGSINITGGSANVFAGSGGNITINPGQGQFVNGNIVLSNLRGNVAIGTTTAAARLTLVGAPGSNPFSIASSTGASLFAVLQNGNVGIGTTTPGSTLTVAGTTRITGATTLGGLLSLSSSGVALGSDTITDFTGTGLAVSSGQLSVSTSSLGLANGFFAQGGNSFGATALLGTNDAQALQFETNGVVRQTILSGGGAIFGPDSFSFNQLGGGNGDVKVTGGLEVDQEVYINVDASGTSSITFSDSNPNFAHIVWDGNTSGFTIDATAGGSNKNIILNPNPSGSVAIGTTSPASRLDVFGDITLSAGSSTITSLATSSSGSPLTVRTGNAIGSGASGALILESGAAGGGGSSGPIFLRSGSGSANTGSVNILTPNTGGSSGSVLISTGNGVAAGSISLTAGNGSSVNGGSINLQAGNGSIAAGAINITAGTTSSAFGNITLRSGNGAGGNILLNTTAGNVGIGTTTAGSRLTVGGDVNITGAVRVNGNAGTSGQVLQSTGSTAIWVATSSLGLSGGGGTVTSVEMTVPTGLTITGSPITTSGTLAVSLTSGYVIPLIASTTDWQTAFSWGNHASAGYLNSAAIDTSAELATILGDETGSGAAVFGTSPTFTTNATFFGETISDFTGTGLSLVSGALTVSTSSLGLANGFFAQNGNSFGATAVLGTNDAQSLQFETNGTVRQTILSSGNVGIGTTTPGSLLTVAGSVAATGQVNFRGGLNMNGTNLNMNDGSLSGGGDIYMDFGNLIGVNSIDLSGIGSWTAGTFAPAGIINMEGNDINSAQGDIYGVDRLVIGTSSPTTARLYVQGNATTFPVIVASSTAGGGTLFSVNQSGDVAIGRALTISGSAGSAGQVLVSSGAAAAPVWTATSSLGLANGFFAQGGNSFGAIALLGTNDNQALQFETNASVVMTLLTNGNVGIGTTSPGSLLSVQGDAVIAGTSTVTNLKIGNHSSVVANNSLVLAAGNCTNCLVQASGQGSVAMGYTIIPTGSGFSRIITAGSGAFASGYVLNIFGSGTSTLQSSGSGSFAQGYISVSSGSGSIIASGSGSYAGGVVTSAGGAIISSNTGSYVWGTDNATSSGSGSVVFGKDIAATANNAFALGTDFTNATANSFQVGFSSTPTLTVTADALGIASTSPSLLLTVAGTSSQRTILPEGPYTTNISPYSLGSSGARWNQVWTDILNLGTSTYSVVGRVGTSDRFAIFDGANGGGNERFTIRGGNVGIGSSTPGYQLAVNGTAYFSTGENTNGFVIANGISDWNHFRINGDAGNIMLDENNVGNVLIGTTSVLAKFTVAGSARITGAAAVDGLLSLGSAGLSLGGDTITDLTGTGLTVSSGVLTVSTSSLGFSPGGVIGGTVSGGSAHQILFTSSTGTLAGSDNFTWNNASSTLGINLSQDFVASDFKVLEFGSDPIGSFNSVPLGLYWSNFDSGNGRLEFRDRSGSGSYTFYAGNIMSEGFFGNSYTTNYAPVGSVGSPTYSFNGDENTGIYRPAVDSLGFVTNGTEAMRILSDNRVGIGTTSPVARFSITGSSSLSTDMSFRVTNNSNVNLFSIDNDGDLRIGGNRIIIKEFGSVIEFRNNVDSNFAGIRANTVATNGLISTSASGFSAPLGSLTAPTYYFGTDTNTGMWSPGADIIAFSTGGTEALRILANSNIGIGTTTPGQRLHIEGTFNNNSAIRAGSLEFQPFSLGNAWIGENVFYNGSNFVRRNTGAAGLFYFFGAEGQFRFTTSASAGTAFANNNSQFKVNADGSVALGGSINSTAGNYTGASLLVNSTGNIGLGTTTPSTRLHLYNDSVDTELSIQRGGTNRFGLRAEASVFRVQNNGTSWMAFDVTNSDISFSTAASFTFNQSGQSMRWRYDGGSNSFIATTSAGRGFILQPDQGTQARSSASGIVALIARGAASQTADLFQVQNSGATTLFEVAADGKVGIGSTTPAYLLSLSGGAYSDGATWTNASSRGIKENFEELDHEDILNKIEGLEISEWNYIGHSSTSRHVGPIAESFFEQFELGGTDKAISSVDSSGVALAGVQALVKRFSTIGATIKDGVLSFTQLITERLYADEVQTKKLCVEDVCLTKDVLESIIRNAGQSTIHYPAPDPEPIPDPVGEPIDNSGSGGGDATDPEPDPQPEPDPIPEPAPEEEPAPQPEPAPEPASSAEGSE